ncbi:MAG: membrane metalloprotease [Vicingaceae bacterium]
MNKCLVLLFLSLLLIHCKDDETGNTSSLATNNVGDFANDYLSDERYTSLTIELVYEQDSKPNDASIDNLKSFLENLLNKPGGINIKETLIPDQGNSNISLSEVRDIEKNYRTVFNSGKNSTAFFYFADANYDQDTQNSATLGIAFNSTSMALFQKTIQENTGNIGQASTIEVEEGVLKHEFGHILGLVNLGTPMQSQHEDQAHKKHCDVESCLMYYATETSLFFDNILNSSVPNLDPQCMADLKANGGK